MTAKKIVELEKRIEALERLVTPIKGVSRKGPHREDKLTLDLDDLMISHSKRFKKGVVFSGMAIPSQSDKRFVRWSCSGGFKTDKEFNEFIDQTSANDISKFCNCFSCEEKLLIIRSLIKKGAMTQKEILEFTEISQGQFYHHVKDLISNKLIMKEKSTYDLSPMGHVLSVSFTGIINTFMK